MIIPDANLLFYVANSGVREHAAAHTWWTSALSGPEPVGLCGPAAFAVLRLTTNARVVATPLRVEDAFAYLDNWLSFPLVSWIEPGPQHYRLVRSLLIASGTGGNLVTDAQIAAIAMEHEAAVYSNDTDFARFPGLKWRNPLV
jgi:hypothetical protein